MIERKLFNYLIKSFIMENDLKTPFDKMKEVSLIQFNNSNCIGTMLYVLGKRNWESRIDPTYLNELLQFENLSLIDSPRLNCGVLFVNTEQSCKRRYNFYKEKNERENLDYSDLEDWLLRPGVAHAGIVVSLNPLKIFHRIGVNRMVLTRDSLDSVYLKQYAKNYCLEFCI